MNHHIDAWGRMVFHSADAVDLLMRGCDIADLFIEPDAITAQYNKACMAHDKTQYLIQPITPLDDDTQRRRDTWFVPQYYRNLAVRPHLLAMCHRPDQIERVNTEMDLFEQRGLIPVLQLMLYLVDHFREEGIVWGVGRGSSVASYCLFLIGLHKCDSLYYNLNIHEFLK